MRGKLNWVLGLFVCCAASACGGTSNNDSKCGQGSACGGNVVGSWKITSSCVTSDAMMTGTCAGATESITGLDATGNITYAADGTYTSSVTVNGSVSVTMPASCLTQNGITLTCAQLQQGLQQTQNTSGFQSATCTDAGSGSCKCDMVLKSAANNETGTYTTTSAGVLTQTPSNGTAGSTDYCVNGSTLTLSTHQDSTMPGTTTLKGTIVLSKQ